MTSTVTGGCLCGALRYEARGEGSAATLCHCASCRRAAGAPAVAWITWRADEFEWTAGGPAQCRSSDKVRREFCGGCGTPLTYRHDDYPDYVDVTVCSLDDPGAIAPADHTWTEDRLAWMENLDALPTHTRSRSGG